MRIGICDDEREVRDRFIEKIRGIYPEAQLKEYQSGEEVLLDGNPPDILLLDIEMPGKNGMDTARQLRRRHKDVMLIFVTAFRDYVFQSFDVGAFHYLLKPFDDRKFMEVLQRAGEQFEERIRLEDTGNKRETPSLVVTTGGRHIVVNLEDIIYAEVFDRKVVIHTMDSDIEYYGRMKELEKKAGDEFYRSHRGYLVNFRFIRKYDSTTIYMEKGQALMAKQNYREFVRRYLRFIQKKEKE
ncbi:MAG: LytTR family DNA-binding domain-containing protein [Lachnospiraceae bacterium]|nr:LytTR family DNA-binding domain-containing protein [Lachnospiraceae bacterium]